LNSNFINSFLIFLPLLPRLFISVLQFAFVLSKIYIIDYCLHYSELFVSRSIPFTFGWNLEQNFFIFHIISVLYFFRLKKMLPQVLDRRSDLPDEILYGRTGYLFALLYLNKCLGQNTVDSKTVQQVRYTSKFYLKLTGTGAH